MAGFRCEAPDKPVRDLEEHSSALGDLLSSRADRSSPFDFPQWNHAADLLHLAAGVLRVEIDPFLYDFSSVYCSTVGDYQDAKREIISNYQMEMTRFLFTWNAFETIVEGLRPTGWKNGKIRAVGKYLADRFDPEKLIHYDCAVQGLRKLATDRNNPFFLEDSNFDPGGSYRESGIGIKTVSQLRNSLVHTAVELPEPRDWGGPVDGGLLSARSARRLVLYTLQMMLIANYSGSGLNVECYDQELDSEIEVKVDNLLRTIHLEGAVSVP